MDLTNLKIEKDGFNRVYLRGRINWNIEKEGTPTSPELLDFLLIDNRPITKCLNGSGAWLNGGMDWIEFLAPLIQGQTIPEQFLK